MTTRLTLADPEDAGEPTPAAGTVRFAPATRRRVGVDVGDAVRIEGGDATAATVGEDAPDLPAGVVVASEAVRRNAGVDAGMPVTVESITPDRARTVTVSPTRSFSLEGDAGALSRSLTGRALTTGDRIQPDLFGGSIAVSLTVVDVDPEGPVVVTPATTVTVREGDAPPATDPAPVPADVGGLADELEALRRLVAPLSAPGSGIRSPAGVLVHGPSGVGKTLLVGRVATEADLSIHEATPDDCERRDSLSTILRAAGDDAPALIHVEDLETAAPNPDREGGRRGRSALGWLLDRVRDREDLLVVGEATQADAVDPTLRRGGRFDAEIRVGVPGQSARREILGIHAAALDLADDVDLDAVATHAHGYTGADLEAVLVDAATRAAARADGGATVTAADVEAALDAVRPTTLREVTVERPSVSYRDIGGLAPAKREVIRTVEWPLRYPRLFERLAVDAPTGVLLYGPPGTGKTMLAKAVANSTDANFLAVDGPELMNRYVGESERGVREVFERARRIAPSVVFLDELDALAPTRRGADTGAAERVVSQLLTELDGLSPRGSVVVLAATNRPDAVDPALLRPGRIEKRVAVPLPDEDARAEILAIHLDGVPTRGVDTETIAKRTAGYTGSDLAGVVREAALLAMETYLQADGSPDDALDRLVVEPDHLERAIEATRPSVDPEET
ncbi:AAA family ATPase [Haloplanus pelagicus]|jgi:transitional endoplasmic reticulum ATPase|uniref:AAA family ATPase n=1 Tax=Haloplanus pelagicus TaxID=2949995 RepID=UPI00203D7D74|nr:AAA family ATPase [Haloplanus sp. HW8-1]